MEDWKRRLAADPKADLVQNKQLCQFFDFLKDRSKDGLIPGAKRYIREVLGDAESLEDGLYAQMRHAAPEFDTIEGMEFSAKQKERVKTVLKGFAQASRPTAKPGDMLYRPTFCRFLVDTGLVSTEEVSQNGAPSYHEAVRFFDAVARTAGDVSDKDKSLSFGAQRCATLDQCMTVVAQLLGQQAAANGQTGTTEAWGVFEEGLGEAQRVVQALLNEGKRRGERQAKLAEDENTDEAIMRRRVEVFRTHGSPPQFFHGSLREWSRGLKYWVDSTTQNCSPETTAERCQHSFAVECYIRDMLVEPGCVYVCLKFNGLFTTLFEGYCDETRERIVEDENGVRRETVQHMSYAAFFRFCMDFAIFPTLCSFDEVWAAYRSADCMVPIGDVELAVSDKFRRAYKRASLLKLLGGSKELVQDPDLKDKEATSRSSSSSSKFSAGSDEDMLDMKAGFCECGSEFSPSSPLVCRICGRHRFQVTVNGMEKEPHRNDSKEQQPESNARRISQSKETPQPKKTATKGTAGATPEAPSQGNSRRPSIGPQAPPRRNSVAGPPAAATLQVPAKLPDASVTRRRSIASIGGAQLPSAPRERAGSLQRKPTLDLSPGGNSSADTSRRHSKSKADLPDQSAKTPQVRSPRQATHSPRQMESPVSGEESAADPEARKSPAESPPPRIKVCTDFSWLPKPFSQMSKMELSIYSILMALNDGVADRFLHIRGLFAASGLPVNEQGCADSRAVMDFFKWLRLNHELEDESEVKEFIQWVDPNSEGLLDPAELEKAVDCVRRDLWRRGLIEGGPNAFAGGGKLLGEEARRLSSRVTRFGDPIVGEVKSAFGTAAFTESLLLLGFLHMHADLAIKASAPGGIKGLWLVAFLHCRFDQLVREHRYKKEGGKIGREESAKPHVVPTASGTPSLLQLPLQPALARSATDVVENKRSSTYPSTSEASTRPQTRETTEPSRPQTRDSEPASRERGEPPSPTAWSVAGEQPPRATVSADAGGGREGAASGNNGTPPKKGKRISLARASTYIAVALEPPAPPPAPPTPKPPETTPKKASYTSFLERFLTDHQDIFARAFNTANVPELVPHKADQPLPPKVSQQPPQPQPQQHLLKPPGGLVTNERRPSTMEGSRLPDTPADRNQPGMPCDVCGKTRDQDGLGTIFCHYCSGVDAAPLKDGVLYPVFQRRRVRWELKELKTLSDPLTPHASSVAEMGMSAMQTDAEGSHGSQLGGGGPEAASS